jgi:hypothetical protein
MANKPSPKNNTASAAVEQAAGGLLQGIDTTNTVLKNDYAGAYAFWTQADQNMVDENGNKVTPKVSLLDALNTSIQKGYLQAADPTNFFNALKATDWYQKYASQGLQAADAFYNNNPQYQTDVKARTEVFRQQATAEGYQLSDKVLNDLATGSMYTAFDDQSWQAYQKTALAKTVAESASHYNVPYTGGAGVANEQALRKYAQDMGVQLGDKYFTDAASALNDPSKGASIDTYNQHIRQMAQSQYTGFSDLLNKGMTMSQIADPYVQQMARTLEISPENIDFTKDATIQKALGAQIGTDGVSQPIPMWQFNQQLRQDPRWQYTDNARDSVTSIAHGILQSFGVVS